MEGKSLQSISLIIKINQMKKITILLVFSFIVYTNYKGMIKQFKWKQEVHSKIPEKKRINKEPNGSSIGKRAIRPSRISYCQIYQLNY